MLSHRCAFSFDKGMKRALLLITRIVLYKRGKHASPAGCDLKPDRDAPAFLAFITVFDVAILGSVRHSINPTIHTRPRLSLSIYSFASSIIGDTCFLCSNRGVS